MADGFRNQCTQCRSAQKKEWVHKRPDAQQAARDRANRYYQENREYVKARIREYAEANRDKILAKHKTYWHTQVDKEKYNEIRAKSRAERYANDPDFRESRKAEGRHSAKIRRYRIRGADGSHTQKEWLELCDRHGNTCLCCGKETELTRDHVLPISLGGTNDIGNIQPLCLTCNLKKNNKHIDYRK